jgi:hypothetical protein
MEESAHGGVRPGLAGQGADVEVLMSFPLLPSLAAGRVKCEAARAPKTALSAAARFFMFFPFIASMV